MLELETTHHVYSVSECAEFENKMNRLFTNSFQRAVESLSQLLTREMLITKIRIGRTQGDLYINQLEGLIEENHFSSLIKVHSYLDTFILLILPKEEGEQLYHILNGRNQADRFPDQDEVIDSIGELNNIVGLTFVNALANTLGKAINASVPENTFDLLGAVLESVVLQKELINRDIVRAEAEITDVQDPDFNVRLVILSEQTRLMEVLSHR
ncbi:MAG TPA: hypothetical protein ENN17_12625 [bacterium]|nr:hypothetical protein [bacterium]